MIYAEINFEHPVKHALTLNAYILLQVNVLSSFQRICRVMLKKIPTLYGRVVLVQLIAIIVIMAVNGYISYRSNWTRAVAHMNEQIEQVSNRLAFQISLPFWNLDKNAANNMLMYEINNPYISGIAVLQDGKLWTGVIQNSNKEVVLVSDKDNSSPLNFEGDEQPKIKINYKDARDKTWELGDLVLYSTDELLKKLFMSIITEIVIQTIMLIVGISFLTIILLNMFLNKPLEKITHTARRIGEGEIDLQAEVTGTREVQTLATAFNRMTSRLRDSIEELDRYFTCSLDLLCICDINGVFKRLNKEWESTLGYPVSELIGHNFMEFVYSEDHVKTTEQLETLGKNTEVLNFVNRYMHKDGTFRWIEWRSFSYGNLVYAVARDITERIANEKEMRRMNDELEKRVAERTENLTLINRELESFSYSVSHDLRAPLRHIIGFIKLLETQSADVLNEKGKHYLQVIAESAEKMGVLIDQLLQLSRTGRQELNKTQVIMNTLVKEVISGLSSETSNRTITWVIDDLPETRADSSMLSAVLTNLIGNALKFTRNRENTCIHIGSFAGEKKNETVYFVKDNGVGFDMKYQDKLFGVFQRLHNSNDFEGTGIGLANVQRIINRHGGNVWAEGEIDRGASFYFSLING